MVCILYACKFFLENQQCVGMPKRTDCGRTGILYTEMAEMYSNVQLTVPSSPTNNQVLLQTPVACSGENSNNVVFHEELISHF